MSWRDRLEATARVPLADYPTPLVPLPRLSAELGRPVFVKRDDAIGPAFGGNKTRKLEFLLADAQRCGARRVTTFGALQSNHARLTAAAARALGLEAHILYFEPRPGRLTGSLRLCAELGARLHFVPLGAHRAVRMETAIRLARVVARLCVGRSYFIPVGGCTPLGCLGYVRAALELDAQARELGHEDAWVVTAAGTGGTLAGLMAGFALCGSRLRPLGIDVGKLWKLFPASVAALATATGERLGGQHRFATRDVPLVEEAAYVGASYGQPSEAGEAARRHLQALEGIALDPVYTAKAFAGLLDRARRGALGAREALVFLHTGGAAGLVEND